MIVVQEILQRSVDGMKYEYDQLAEIIRREKRTIEDAQLKIDKANKRYKEMKDELTELMEAAKYLNFQLDIKI